MFAAATRVLTPAKVKQKKIKNRDISFQSRRDGNEQESIQLSDTSHQRHQRERNTNTK